MTISPAGDAQTPVVALKTAVAQFAAERDWGRFHSPKNLAMAIAIEAAELMELFQWVDSDQVTARLQDAALREHAAGELADVLIYCLTLANALDLDVSASIAAKLEANRHKYPPGSPQVLDPTSTTLARSQLPGAER